MLITLLAAAVVLGVVILVHELGHFWAAKLLDVHAPRFSIGLGPRMTGFQWGETEYVISWLPLGGYVQLAGMGEDEVVEVLEGGPVDEAEESPDRKFQSKPLWARGVILSAGVFMNFLFAAVAFGVLAGFAGVVPPPDARIGSVYEEYLPEGTVEMARLPYGARVDSVGDRPVADWEEFTGALAAAEGGPVTLHLSEGGPVTLRLSGDRARRDSLLSSLSPVWGLPLEIDEVQEGSPAEAAGLRPGDRIIRMDDVAVEDWSRLVHELERRYGERVPVTVLREGDTLDLTLVPEENVRPVGGDTLRFGRIGVRAAQATLAGALTGERRQMGAVEAAAFGVGETWRLLVLTVDFLADLITGTRGGDELGGPILIGQISGQMARAGFAPLVRFMAFISVQIGILNLLPVPVLDGGHLLFLGIEGVRGRPVNAEHRARWTQAGMLLLVVLMVWVIFQDIFRILG